jgi:hypothetical protein
MMTLPLSLRRRSCGYGGFPMGDEEASGSEYEEDKDDNDDE